jgi:hypothetical protein
VIRFLIPYYSSFFFKCFSSVTRMGIFNSKAGFGDSRMQSLDRISARFAEITAKFAEMKNAEFALRKTEVIGWWGQWRWWLFGWLYDQIPTIGKVDVAQINPFISQG